MSNSQVMPAMPQYRSHKVVSALKIATVTLIDTDTTTDENPIVQITFIETGFDPFTCNLHGKPTPEPGWYYVVYEGGYFSFSPAEAFEKGYHLIDLEALSDTVSVSTADCITPAGEILPFKISQTSPFGSSIYLTEKQAHRVAAQLCILLLPTLQDSIKTELAQNLQEKA